MYLVRVHDEGVLGILIRSESQLSHVKYYLDGLAFNAMLYDDEFTVLYAIEELDE